MRYEWAEYRDRLVGGRAVKVACNTVMVDVGHYTLFKATE